jgi:N-acetyl-gamma-glutamyl-phosphate reductase
MTPVGILGFRGYSGAELVHILSRHPHVEPILLEHRDAEDRPQPLGRMGPRRLKYSCDEVRAAGIAAVFLATPPEVSMELTPPRLDTGVKVIDRSGAFRLRTPENYQR